MAISLTEIKTRVKTRIAAHSAAPSVSDLDDTSIAQWANEKTAEVINSLKDVKHYPSLLVKDGSLTFTSGSVAFPASYQRHVSLTVNANGVSERLVRLYTDPAEFARFDSSNFFLTPNVAFPVGLIADKVYVKPTSITSGKFTYVKSHPTITAGQDTVFDDVADNLLILHILKEYYAFIEAPDLKATIEAEIKEINGDQ